MHRINLAVFALVLALCGLAAAGDTRTWKPRSSEIEALKALRAEQKGLELRRTDIAQQVKQLEADETAVAARLKELVSEIGDRLALTPDERPCLAIDKGGMFCLVAPVTTTAVPK